jgi:hypothetical protein
MGQTCICSDYTLAVYHSGRVDYGSAVRADVTLEAARTRIKKARGDINVYLIGIDDTLALPNEVPLEPLNTEVPPEPTPTSMDHDHATVSPVPTQDTKDESGSAPHSPLGLPSRPMSSSPPDKRPPACQSSASPPSPGQTAPAKGNSPVGTPLNPNAAPFAPDTQAPKSVTILTRESPATSPQGAETRSSGKNTGANSPVISETDAPTPPKVPAKHTSYAAAVKRTGDSDLSDAAFEEVLKIQPVTKQLAKSAIGSKPTKVTDFFPVASVSNNNLAPKPGSMPLQNRLASMSDTSSQSDSDTMLRRSGRLKGRK